MGFDRSSGILLHPTSLPGTHGVGDLGSAANKFIEWLALAEQRLWQVLPLGPTGYGNSPYASPSAFAGNTLLISIDRLVEQGLLDQMEIEPNWPFPAHDVHFDAVIPFKEGLLREAFGRAADPGSGFDREGLAGFMESEREWLDDFALFMALKGRYAHSHWLEWPEALRTRSETALDATRSELAPEVAFHQFAQFLFRQQWLDVKRFANDRGIRIVGDIPIYVAADSADVWANQEEFRLEPDGRPSVVSGVPPDLFTADGQLWGNPVFNWRHMASNGYRWWRRRITQTRKLVDIVRIDHFRGFAAGWVVPAGDPTARTGRWQRGPGRAIFDAIAQDVGDQPMIIEDLGLITPDVHALRRELGFPGMNVLQFGFDGNPRSQYLPHMYEQNSVVYPGTHDNQTTIGWFQSLGESERRQVQTYIGADGSDIAWNFIRLALQSVSDVAIIALQDVMRLGDEARMNTPGLAVGNWRWRYQEHQLHDGLAAGLAEFTRTYGRAEQEARAFAPDPFDYSVPGAEHILHEPRAS